LEGGEVLLTTGLGVRSSAELQRKLIAGLDQRGCAAVGFGLGVVLDAVPEAMVDEADRRQLPLFTVPYEVPFIAVAKRVSHHVAAEHYATLRAAVDLHRQVLAAVISGGGVSGVVQTVARQLPDHACLVFDYYGKLLASEGVGAGAVTSAGAAAIWADISAAAQLRERFEVPTGGRLAFGSPVRVGDEVEAVFVLLGDRPLLEHEALLLEQGLAGVGLEMARGLSVRESHRARVDQILDEVAAARLSGPELERRLEHLGFDATLDYRAMVLPRPPSVSARGLCALAEDVLAVDGSPLVGRRDDAVLAIVQPDNSDAPQRLVAAGASRGWRLTVGCSRGRRDVTELAAALREATVAAASGGPGIADVADLGLAGLLAGLDEEHGASAFVETVLGPVLGHDRRESTALVDTLRRYLEHGCRPGPAAEQLRIHRHTLAYRLDRIRDLTGKDPRSGEHLLEFALALELLNRDSDTARTRTREDH
jgi:purine catabolism regulator